MKILTIISLFILCISCNNGNNEDKTKTIEKDGSIETTLSITHLSDSFDILRTEKNIWLHNQLVKTIVTNDTIPALGNTTEVGENSNGDDTTVSIKKNYQIFITVK